MLRQLTLIESIIRGEILLAKRTRVSGGQKVAEYNI